MSEEEIILAAKEYVKTVMGKNDPSHDYAHVERVYQTACHIVNKGRDEVGCFEVVKLAALFHDLADFKYVSENQRLEDVARDRLDEFFKQFPDFPPEDIQKIHYIITNISWRKELEAREKGIVQPMFPEFAIVRDADRLDAIGAIGVGRCFAYSGHTCRPFGRIPDSVNLLSSEEYNTQTRTNDGDTLGHFYEKLLFIIDHMQTKTGKEMAVKRHEFMKTFLAQFNEELRETCCYRIET